MSLMRLLTVGRSIATIKDQPSRYKMTQQNLLPKFGPPNRSEATAAPLQPTQTPAAKIEKIKQAPASQKEMPTTKKKMSAEALNDAGPDEQSVSASPNVPKAAFPGGRWSRIRNPFGARKTAEVERVPTQGELSLDMVKPVRNDLNDADLEVVLCRKRPVDPEKEISAPAERHEPVGYLWSRLSSRLFRTQQL